MRKTMKTNTTTEKILIDTVELQNTLCSGRAAAIKVGVAACAKVQVGRRVFWNVQKVRQYIDTISE